MAWFKKKSKPVEGDMDKLVAELQDYLHKIEGKSFADCCALIQNDFPFSHDFSDTEACKWHNPLTLPDFNFSILNEPEGKGHTIYVAGRKTYNGFVLFALGPLTQWSTWVSTGMAKKETAEAKALSNKLHKKYGVQDHSHLLTGLTD